MYELDCGDENMMKNDESKFLNRVHWSMCLCPFEVRWLVQFVMLLFLITTTEVLNFENV